MSGFSTTRSNVWAIDNYSKQHGSILRGWGPPVPKAGVVGDLYVDAMTFQLFEKRRVNSLDDWGHYLFVVPETYRSTLKFFGPSPPSNSLGGRGDHFLHWAGYDNYGMNISLWGPKLEDGWSENGSGSGTVISPTSTGVLTLGLADEGSVLADMMLNQLVAIGLDSEYIVPLPVTANPSDPVSQDGVQNSGRLIIAEINPLYTAEDKHGI